MHPLSQLERAATKLKVNNLLQCRFFTIVQNVFNVAPIKNEKITMNKFFTVKILAVSISIGMVWLQFRWLCFRSTEYFQQVSRFVEILFTLQCENMLKNEGGAQIFISRNFGNLRYVQWRKTLGCCSKHLITNVCFLRVHNDDTPSSNY